MGFFLQPWFLILFAVAGFLFFFAISSKDGNKAQLPKMTRWIVVGICVVIVIFGVFSKVL